MTAKEYRAAYPYLYETHLHTTEGSACAGSGGAGMAYACKTAGYTGIFVTDHNWHGNTAVDKSLPWEAFVERFTKGYEAVKRVGDRIGLDVFFGWEAGYDGTEFLIYGLSKECSVIPRSGTLRWRSSFRLCMRAAESWCMPILSARSIIFRRCGCSRTPWTVWRASMRRTGCMRIKRCLTNGRLPMEGNTDFR